MSSRYQVHKQGTDMWCVVDRSTGKKVGFRRMYKAALEYADTLHLSTLIRLEMARAV